jgi:hypothetical protein
MQYTCRQYLLINIKIEFPIVIKINRSDIYVKIIIIIILSYWITIVHVAITSYAIKTNVDTICHRRKDAQQDAYYKNKTK